VRKADSLLGKERRQSARQDRSMRSVNRHTVVLEQRPGVQRNGPGQQPVRWAADAQWVAATLSGVLIGGSILLNAALDRQLTLLLMVVLISPFVVMVSGNLEKLLMAIIIIEIPIQLDTYLFYNEAATEWGALPGWNLSLTTFCLAVLYALWLAELLAKRSTLPAYLGSLSLPLVAYLSAVLLSLFAARDLLLASAEPFLLVQALLLFVYVLARIRTRDDIVFMVTMLLIALLLASTSVIIGRVLGESTSFGPIQVHVDAGQLSRVGGTIGSPNGAGGYLSLLLVMAPSLLLTPVARWQKSLAVLAFCFGCVALLFTFSRGGWGAFVISFSLFVVCSGIRGWLSLRLIVGLAAIGLILALIFQEPILARLNSDDGGAARSRIPLMELARQVITDHPIVGVGANNAAVVLPNYITPEFKHEFLYVFHNKYLLVWAEAGPMALVTYLWVLGATIYRGWRVWQQNDPLLSPLALGLSTGLIGQMAHMNVDIFNGRPLVQMQWLYAGLLAVLLVQALRLPETKPVASTQVVHRRLAQINP
jgi:putative inorganic carbon (HCO3(-)) transporter